MVGSGPASSLGPSAFGDLLDVSTEAEPTGAAGTSLLSDDDRDLLHDDVSPVQPATGAAGGNLLLDLADLGLAPTAAAQPPARAPAPAAAAPQQPAASAAGKPGGFFSSLLGSPVRPQPPQQAAPQQPQPPQQPHLGHVPAPVTLEDLFGPGAGAAPAPPAAPALVLGALSHPPGQPLFHDTPDPALPFSFPFTDPPAAAQMNPQKFQQAWAALPMAPSAGPGSAPGPATFALGDSAVNLLRSNQTQQIIQALQARSVATMAWGGQDPQFKLYLYAAVPGAQLMLAEVVANTGAKSASVTVRVTGGVAPGLPEALRDLLREQLGSSPSSRLPWM